MIGRESSHELLEVPRQSLDREVDTHEVFQIEAVWLLNRDETTAPTHRPGSARDLPAKCLMAFEHLVVRCCGSEFRECPLSQLEDALQTAQQLSEATHDVEL